MTASHANSGFLRSRRRKRGPRRRNLTWLYVAGSLVLLYAMLLGDSGLFRILQTQQDVQALDDRLQWVDAQQVRLEARLDELRQPRSFMLEKVAREEYGMIRPGDRVIHVIDQTDRPMSGPPLPPRLSQSTP